MRLAPRNSSVVLALTFVFAYSTNSNAIVVVPSGSDNSIAPTDDPGWLNVGNRGVYIGNRWVLTVAHVGAGSTTFPSVGTFSVEPGTTTPLTNPIGFNLTPNTDLVLYRLSTDPGLPVLDLALAAPTTGTPVTLISDGQLRTGSTLYWDVTMNGPDDWTWTPVASNGSFSGYGSSGSGKRWGTNLIEETVAENPTLVEVNSGFGDVISYTTAFDMVSQFTNDEAQAQTGDSGGAVFAKTAGGDWVLSGMIHAVGGFPDQPLANTTAIDGDRTFIADLSSYRSQVVSVTGVPEPNGCVLLIGMSALLLGTHRRSRFNVSQRQ